MGKLKWVINQKRQLFVPGPPPKFTRKASAFRQLSVRFLSAFRATHFRLPVSGPLICTLLSKCQWVLASRLRYGARRADGHSLSPPQPSSLVAVAGAPYASDAQGRVYLRF